MGERARIGVYGGTFDPVHVAHLRMALEVSEALALDQMHMVVSAAPPHRGAPTVSADHRLRMLQLALEGCPSLRADDRELRREGPSWMVDTLRELRAEYGTDAALCLVMGADAFAGLQSWGRWQELPLLAHLAVLERPGSQPLPPSLAEWALPRWAEHPAVSMGERPGGHLFRMTLSQLDISATALRDRLTAGRSVRFLVPDRVLDYIDSHRLYRGTGD